MYIVFKESNTYSLSLSFDKEQVNDSQLGVRPDITFETITLELTMAQPESASITKVTKTNIPRE